MHAQAHSEDSAIRVYVDVLGLSYYQRPHTCPYLDCRQTVVELAQPLVCHEVAWARER